MIFIPNAYHGTVGIVHWWVHRLVGRSTKRALATATTVTATTHCSTLSLSFALRGGHDVCTVVTASV
jgi:hypothetical protein